MTVDMLPWVIARATGFAAVALLAGAMLAGLMVRTRTAVAGVRGGGMVDLHRHFSFLALGAIAVHGLALVLDSTVHIPLSGLVIPGLSSYRPLATGIGVVVAELALLIHLSFRYRNRIGMRTWRRLHFLTYAVFAGGVVHGIAAGTDAGSTAAVAFYATVVAAVIGATAWRIQTASRPARRERPRAAAVPAHR